MELTRLPVAKIKAAPYNPRKDLQPGDPEWEKIARSIEEFGYVEPVIWNKRTGHIVGGHQRFKVLIHQGAGEVDVVVVDLPPAREKALNIALNKITGEWDVPRLQDLLQEIDTGEFDLSLTGFDDAELERLISFESPGLNGGGAEGQGEGEDGGDGAEPGISEGAGLGQPVIGYNIVFDDEVQQKVWYDFLRYLKGLYPHLETVGARLQRYIEEHVRLAP